MFAAMVGQEQSQIDDSALVKALIAPVQNAGRVIMDFYQTDPYAETKVDGSPVTKADHAAEAILLAEIATLAPTIKIISEENAASHKFAASQEFFLVDPLDGTKEFIKARGDGAFTVNIGLIRNGEPAGSPFRISPILTVKAPSPRALINSLVPSSGSTRKNSWLAANLWLAAFSSEIILIVGAKVAISASRIASAA